MTEDLKNNEPVLSTTEMDNIVKEILRTFEHKVLYQMEAYDNRLKKKVINKDILGSVIFELRRVLRYHKLMDIQLGDPDIKEDESSFSVMISAWEGYTDSLKTFGVKEESKCFGNGNPRTGFRELATTKAMRNAIKMVIPQYIIVQLKKLGSITAIEEDISGLNFENNNYVSSEESSVPVNNVETKAATNKVDNELKTKIQKEFGLRKMSTQAIGEFLTEALGRKVQFLSQVNADEMQKAYDKLVDLNVETPEEKPEAAKDQKNTKNSKTRTTEKATVKPEDEIDTTTNVDDILDLI